MANVWDYLGGVALEGLLVGFAFWILTYITMESSSLRGAVRAGLISEAVGNLPYLAGIGATEPPGILMAIVGAVVFVRVILSVGELTVGKASYGVLMTYFFLVALVTCNA